MYHLYKFTFASALLAACGILVSSAITAEPLSAGKPGEMGSITIPVTSNGVLSQCGDIFKFSPKNTDYGIVPDEYEKNFVPVHPMIIPVYGFMDAEEFNVEEALALPLSENPYNILQINRALWDGVTFIWLHPNTSQETHDYIMSYAENWNTINEDKVVPLTWKQDRNIPLSRNIAFSSWGVSQSCITFSDKTFEDFMKTSRDHQTSKQLPEVVLENGDLPKHEQFSPSSPPLLNSEE